MKVGPADQADPVGSLPKGGNVSRWLNAMVPKARGTKCRVRLAQGRAQAPVAAPENLNSKDDYSIHTSLSFLTIPKLKPAWEPYRTPLEGAGGEQKSIRLQSRVPFSDRNTWAPNIYSSHPIPNTQTPQHPNLRHPAK